jgi:hypothetical protein
MVGDSQSKSERPNPSSPARYRTPWLDMTPRFQIIWAVCFIVAVAYTVYSLATGSGLFGYLMALEMNLIGMAEETITAMLTFGVLVAPLWAVTGIVAKIAPTQVWAAANRLPPRSPGGSTLLEKLNRPVDRISWKAVLGATAIPLLTGVVVFAVMYNSDQRDQQERIYPIDIRSAAADPPKNAKFVELTGLVARSYTLTFKHSNDSTASEYELFVPITEAGWTSTDPVRYFARASAYEASLGQGDVRWPDAFRQSSAAQFSGRISQSLPAYVETKYRSRGLKFGPSYLVIELMDFPDHKVPSSNNALLAAGICLLIAVSAFAILTMVKFMLPAIRKRQAAL